MTGRQLRKMLAGAKMSQMQLSRELGVGGRTVRSWISGASPISRVVEYAIRYLLYPRGRK